MNDAETVGSLNSLKKISKELGLSLYLTKRTYYYFKIGKPKAKDENCFFLTKISDVESFLKGVCISQNKDWNKIRIVE